MWTLPEYTWGQERELCRRCTHYRERVAGSEHIGLSVVMSCALNRSRTGGKRLGTCIDMRYDGACGREGRLFEPREGK